MSYLCVDGGQTKTDVSLLNARGETLELWEAGPLTTPSKPGAIENLHEVISSVAEELRQRLEHSASGPPEAACFSLTGYLEEDERIPSLVRREMKRVIPDLERVHTVPDYVGNWAAVTRGEPGILILSGGGAVAYGRAASGESLRVGGWGHWLGDEGSGYWIGLNAIRAALRSWAGMTSSPALETRVMETIGADGDRQVLGEVYSGSFSEADIAGLVPLVVSLADEGDRVSIEILDEAAQRLTELCRAVLDRLGTMPIYPSGGVFRAPGMLERFERSLAEAGREVEVRPTSVEPSEGIFLIARGGILE